MANHASAIKRIRSNETKRARNRYQLKSCRTAIKKLRSNKVAEEAVPQFQQVSSMLDKLAKRNIIHKNKSASMKSSLAKHVNKLSAKASSMSTASKKVKEKPIKKASSEDAQKAADKKDEK